MSETKKRKFHTPEYKAKVALEALRSGKTINQISQEFDVHPIQVGQWKKALQEQAKTLFEGKRGPKPVDHLRATFGAEAANEIADIDEFARQIQLYLAEAEPHLAKIQAHTQSLRDSPHPMPGFKCIQGLDALKVSMFGLQHVLAVA